MIQSSATLLVEIVFLGREDKIRCEFRIAVERLDTLQDVAEVNVKAHAVDSNKTVVKRGPRRQ